MVTDLACFAVATVFGVIVHFLRRHIPANWHVNWLLAMIFGGAGALAVEHIAHGEIVPWPPFLTAMANPADTAAMVGEMLSVGVPMLLGIMLAWILLVVVYEKFFARVPSLLGADS